MGCSSCGGGERLPLLWVVRTPRGDKRFMTRAEALGYAVRNGGRVEPADPLEEER